LLDMPERLATLKGIGARSARVGEAYQHVAMARERCGPANEIAAAQFVERVYERGLRDDPGAYFATTSAREPSRPITNGLPHLRGRPM
jgi:hypothetical protein